MLESAYDRMTKEDDEWDKTAKVLAEHMRNASNEFPMLADEFRTILLQCSLDVQKRRTEIRNQQQQQEQEFYICEVED